MIKRGTARRLGLKRPQPLIGWIDEIANFSTLGISMAEMSAAWPAQQRLFRQIRERM